MKKARVLMVALGLTLALTLAGCGGGGSSSAASTPAEGSGAAASTSGGADVYAEDGYAEGRLGDVMHNSFFDYTVHSAYLCDEMEGYTAAEGNELLVAEVTVKNTDTESIPMFDTDFQVQWNTDGEDDYGYPVAPPVSDEQLEEEYSLAINESRTGLLVFEVPAGFNDFSISYQEFYEDESEGDVFFVFFTAQKQSAAV